MALIRNDESVSATPEVNHPASTHSRSPPPPPPHPSPPLLLLRPQLLCQLPERFLEVPPRPRYVALEINNDPHTNTYTTMPFPRFDTFIRDVPPRAHRRARGPQRPGRRLHAADGAGELCRATEFSERLEVCTPLRA